MFALDTEFEARAVQRSRPEAAHATARRIDAMALLNKGPTMNIPKDQR
jgi:hypothetical protein